MTRALRVVVGAAVASLAIAGAALGATGDLTFAECFDDEDTNQEAAACANTPGLDGATGVVTSADGKSLYVASAVDDAIVNFNRDPTTGALSFEECFDDEDSDPGGGPSCTDTPALDGARSVALSADGNLYVASVTDDAIVNFTRDPGTGTLTFLECVDDEDTGGEGGTTCDDAPGLNAPQAVAASADGKSLFVASVTDDAVVSFTRDPVSGALDFSQCFDDEDTDPEATSCTGAPGLDGAVSVAPSADGKSLYAASQTDAAVVNLSRDPGTGALGFSECLEDEDTGSEGDSCANAPGLDGARSVAASGDGKSLYAASQTDAAVVGFTRDPGTGALVYSECFEDEDTDLEGPTCADLPGLEGAQSLVTSADGRSLYAASQTNDAIVNFARASSGELELAQCFDDEDENPEGPECAGAPGLDGAQSVAASANGKSLYAASSLDDAAVRFDREPEPPPPPDDGGDPGKADRTLTLDANKDKVKKGKKVRFSGELEATGNAGCEASHSIEILRAGLKQGSPQVVATTQTDSSGDYAAKLKVTKSSLYSARTPETAECEAASSDAVQVAVKKSKRPKDD